MNKESQQRKWFEKQHKKRGDPQRNETITNQKESTTGTATATATVTTTNLFLSKDFLFLASQHYNSHQCEDQQTTQQFQERIKLPKDAGNFFVNTMKNMM